MLLADLLSVAAVSIMRYLVSPLALGLHSVAEFSRYRIVARVRHTAPTLIN